MTYIITCFRLTNMLGCSLAYMFKLHVFTQVTKHICIIINKYINNNVHGRKLESWIKYTIYLNYQFR